MKFEVCGLIGLACVISAFAAPTDELRRAGLEFLFEKRLPHIFYQYRFGEIIVNSIDKDCVLEKLESYKFASFLTDWGKYANILIHESPDTDTFENSFKMIAASISCSKRTDALLEFSYDTLNSFGKLLHAFKDDHDSIREYFEFMPCAINYAVEKKLFDAADYPTYDYSYGNVTKETCEAKTTELLELLNGENPTLMSLEPEARKCFHTTANEFITNFALKYVVLILNGMTDAQRVAERAHYINDIHVNVEKSLNCFVKTEEIIENSIDWVTSWVCYEKSWILPNKFRTR